MGLLEPLIPWVTWRMKGTILSLPGSHPAHLHGGNGFRIVFPTNKLVFNESNLKVGLFATKRGLEVEDWGGFGLMGPAWCLLGPPTAGVWGPCAEPEPGMWSPLQTPWLKPVVGRAMGAVTWRRFGGALA